MNTIILTLTLKDADSQDKQGWFLIFMTIGFFVLSFCYLSLAEIVQISVAYKIFMLIFFYIAWTLWIAAFFSKVLYNNSWYLLKKIFQR